MTIKIKTMFENRPAWLKVLPLLMIVAGSVLLVFSLIQQVTIISDGLVISGRSLAITPADALKQAGITIYENDRVIPPLNTKFFSPGTIHIERAETIQIMHSDTVVQLSSTNRIPANLLQEAGIRLFPHDQVLWNGAQIDFDKPLVVSEIGMIQVKPAQQIILNLDGNRLTIFSAHPTLGMALSESGIKLAPHDSISPSLETRLDSSLQVEIFTARSIQVATVSGTITGLSSAQTVGAALQDLGITLQSLDYCVPSENDPVPANGKIAMVRVWENLLLAKEEYPFSVTYQPDPETELDQGSVVKPGVLGLIINRTRIRYENGQEANRQVDEPWQASAAQDGILGYGTKVVVRSEMVDGVNLEYYRKLSLYATSYSPSRLGVPGLISDKTASGLKLEKGIVAVLTSWYRVMKFQRVYIPGYGFGIVADTGGGIPGTPWIDLGYSDNDYIGWHSWVSVYFLTPVPSYIPYLLP